MYAEVMLELNFSYRYNLNPIWRVCAVKVLFTHLVQS